MELTQQQLQQLLPKNPYIEQWHHALSQFLPEYEINTPQRIAAFIAQCSHESAGFTALKENLNYSAQGLANTWPTRFAELDDVGRPIKPYKPTAFAKHIERNPEMIANAAYADRMGNGDFISGDGWRYCGRGLIQLTGKNNYQLFADSIQMNIEDVPEYLVTFDGAVHSACWFWKSNNLNSFSDVGDIKGLTRAINGGYNGLDDRIKHYEHALRVLGVS